MGILREGPLARTQLAPYLYLILRGIITLGDSIVHGGEHRWQGMFLREGPIIRISPQPTGVSAGASPEEQRGMFRDLDIKIS